MSKLNLTDKFISSGKRVPKQGRKDYHDCMVPGLALRVSSTGHRSFVLVTRYPINPKNPTRRKLGNYGALTLNDARTKARDWLQMIQLGRDPKIVEARRKAEERRKAVNSFGVVCEEFLTRHAAKLAEGTVMRQRLEKEFVKRWRDRPVTDILPEEVADAIRAIVKRGTPYQAHHAFADIRQMFNWAIGTHEFGITASPAERLRPNDLIGARKARHRILKDDELRNVWAACEWSFHLGEGKRVRATLDSKDMGYPYGPLIRLLILTGLRENEVACMRWSEIELDKKLWTIPAERMKNRRAHEVPLAPDMLALIRSLPRFKGDYVFTTTGGEKPVSGFAKGKARIDKLSGVEGWQFHDLRRTMRTHLSALPVQDIVRELTIAHAKPGLHAVYDQHAYRDEKLECLTLWESRLQGILAPKPPPDVADLEEARGWQEKRHDGRVSTGRTKTVRAI